MACSGCGNSHVSRAFPINVRHVENSPFAKGRNIREATILINHTLKAYNYGRPIPAEYVIALKMMGLIPSRDGRYTKIGKYADPPEKPMYDPHQK